MNTCVVSEIQQILVAGDNVVRAGALGAFQNAIVIGITGDDLKLYVRNHALAY